MLPCVSSSLLLIFYGNKGVFKSKNKSSWESMASDEVHDVERKCLRTTVPGCKTQKQQLGVPFPNVFCVVVVY